MTNKLKLLYIVSYYGIGPLNYLEKYLQETGEADLTTINLPPIRLVNGRLVIKSVAVESDGNRIEYTLDIPFPWPAFFVYPAHYLLAPWVFFKVFSRLNRKKFDICFAEPCYNVIFSSLLKLLGRADFIVFVNGDIIPDRKFGQDPYYVHTEYPSGMKRLLASVIHWLLTRIQMGFRWLGYRGDLIWCVTDKIKQWDRARGLIADKVMVEGAIFVDYDQVKSYRDTLKSSTALGYIGRLNEGAGVGLMIRSLVLIKEKISDIHLHIVGGSDATVAKYRALAKDVGILENVTLYGFVTEISQAFDILSRVSLGLALYNPGPDNGSLYTEQGKVKDYIKVNLPVVITRDGPEISQDFARFNAGILVNYEEEDVAEKIVAVLSSPERYRALQKGVDQFARYYDYRQGIPRAWQQVVSFYGNKYQK